MIQKDQCLLSRCIYHPFDTIISNRRNVLTGTHLFILDQLKGMLFITDTSRLCTAI